MIYFKDMIKTIIQIEKYLHLEITVSIITTIVFKEGNMPFFFQRIHFKGFLRNKTVHT